MISEIRTNITKPIQTEAQSDISQQFVFSWPISKNSFFSCKLFEFGDQAKGWFAYFSEMSAANNKVYQFKLVLLGESAVGKSSLVLRFVRGQFFDYQESTIGGTKSAQILAVDFSDLLASFYSLFWPLGCSQPHSWHKQWLSAIQLLNLKYGTRRVKSVTIVLRPCITGVLLLPL